MKFNMITEKHNYDNGYISLVNLMLRNVPEMITVDDYELTRKSEFHISVMALKHLAPMLGVNDEAAASSQLKQDFLDFSKTHSLDNFRLIGEYRLVKRDERVAVVSMVELENIDKLFDYLRTKYSVDFPTQPTHITMYTLQPEAGIGILSSDELTRDSVAVNVPALTDLEIENDKN